jgi:NAD(P)-dependent dehydrogenase (short-subunit alcohol dehydrogenase family)
VDHLITQIKKKTSKARLKQHGTHIVHSHPKQVHILVNNSGATYGAPWNDFPEKAGWDRVMDLNVKAMFYCECFATVLDDNLKAVWFSDRRVRRHFSTTLHLI